MRSDERHFRRAKFRDRQIPELQKRCSYLRRYLPKPPTVRKSGVSPLSSCSCSRPGQVHHRFTVGFLITGCHHPVDGKRILFHVVTCFSSRQPITRASVAVNSYFIAFPFASFRKPLNARRPTAWLTPSDMVAIVHQSTGNLRIAFFFKAAALKQRAATFVVRHIVRHDTVDMLSALHIANRSG